MNVTKLALKRPVSCFLIVLALAVFGIGSIFGFKLELTPNMELPMLIVYTMYPGADPESVEELVTEVIEEAGSTLSGVENVMTQSYDSYSMIIFEYEYGVDLDECYTDLRAVLDTASMSLPEDASDPTVIEMNMDSADILTISATEKGDIDLLKVINDTVVPELETISGVAQVNVYGGTEELIKVVLKEDLMNQYGLTMANIAQYIAAIDFTYPAGTVEQGRQEISISTSMEYNTVQMIQSVPLMTARGAVIQLQDIADVYGDTEEAESISRFNGADNVSIGLKNRSSHGTVNVCESVKEKLEELKQENPAIDFQVTYDASSAILDSLGAVGETLILGVLLTMAVLFLFFGDFKASLVVGSAMPISLFLTLILMNFMGFSMNIVTLGSLVIAIGMMVDSAIVVIESCFRLKEQHAGFREAALEGTKIVTASIIASTITTIVVYVPLATLKGLSGQIFEELGFTIIFAMLASLIAALTLVPLFYCIFKPVEKKTIPMNRILEKIVAGYRKLIRWVLGKRVFVLLFTIVIFVVSIFMASTLNMELMPSADEGVVQISVAFRSGTSLEAKDEAMQEWEKIVSEDSDVASYSISIDSSSTATLTAALIKERSMSTSEMVDKWNELASTMTNMDVSVATSGSSMSAMMVSGSYEIDLESYDYEALKDYSKVLEEEFKKVDGVMKVDNSASDAATMAKVVVDPLKAMNYGLTPISIGTTLNNVLSGINAITITREGAEYDVFVEYPEGAYDNLNDLLNYQLLTQAGTMVPLQEVAEIVYTDEAEMIYKQNGKYIISLVSTLRSDKVFEAQDAINAIVEYAEFPNGVQAVDSMMTGMMLEELEAIFVAILVAVFLVFLVMAMQFESVRFSIMVMVCIPFALIGSFGLLYVTQSTLSMVSMMGLLMLMGIVVNNGILFVDSTNQLSETMSVEDALVETGAIRLRPILMTTLTTILSMVPMGLGMGTNGVMMQGMALVIIGGLVASTLLTLILIPTIYMIVRKKTPEEKAMKKAMKKSRKVKGRDNSSTE